MFESTVITELNKLAGAPDWEGGSGIVRHIYFLNSEKNMSIVICLGSIRFIKAQPDGSVVDVDLMGYNQPFSTLEEL